MSNGNSMSANFSKKPASIKKANQVAYKTKDGSDGDEKSHGSRPSHINTPGKSAKKV